MLFAYAHKLRWAGHMGLACRLGIRLVNMHKLIESVLEMKKPPKGGFSSRFAKAIFALCKRFFALRQSV